MMTTLIGARHDFEDCFTADETTIFAKKGTPKETRKIDNKAFFDFCVANGFTAIKDQGAFLRSPTNLWITVCA